MIKRTLKFIEAEKINGNAPYQKKKLTMNFLRRLQKISDDEEIPLETLECEFKGIKNSKDSILYLLKLCYNVLDLYFEIGKKFQNVAILLYHFLTHVNEVEKNDQSEETDKEGGGENCENRKI